MPVAKHHSPNLTWSFELPDRLKLVIADAITLYSRIKFPSSSRSSGSWKKRTSNARRKSPRHGRPELPAHQARCQTDPRAKTGAIWPALKAIGKERNLIGHGVWLWTSEERPLIVWHSKFLEDAEWVGAEFFDYTRFDYFMRRAEVLMNTFANFKLLCPTSAPVRQI